jgi:hypothetical protein
MSDTKLIFSKKNSAQERLVVTFAGFFLNTMNLKSFHRTTVECLAFGQQHMKAQWDEGVKQSRELPQIEALLKSKSDLFDDEFLSDMSEAMAARSVNLAVRTANSAVLVFAHTLLDEVLSECCRISFEASPTDWYGFVQKRKVEISSLFTEKRNAILRTAAKEFVNQLTRESMVERFEYLNRVCAPKYKGAKIPTSWLTREELEKFDRMRHRIIHGKPFSPVRTDVGDQIQLVVNAGLSALTLVGESHHLLKGLKDLSMSPRRFLRFFALAKREYPEFVALMEKRINKISLNERAPNLKPE